MLQGKYAMDYIDTALAELGQQRSHMGHGRLTGLLVPIANIYWLW